MIRDRLHTTARLDEEQAQRLRSNTGTGYTVQVLPSTDSLPATLDTFVANIKEIQTKWMKLRNTSPIAAYEIRRHTPDTVTFQYAVPTRRLERKVRSHLATEVPNVRFDDGVSGLPVTENDDVGGGILSMGRPDCYPLRTEFDNPPVNSLAAALHRHAMQDTRFVIQILFQPNAGRPLRRWWWRRRGYQRRNHLKKEKEKLWGSVNPTHRERNQARAIDDKVGNARFHTSIRYAIIGAEDHTPSRVKEIAGAFNVFESPVTGQFLNANTVRSIRQERILGFATSIANREFGSWSRRFYTSEAELAGLVSLPDTDQKNIRRVKP